MLQITKIFRHQTCKNMIYRNIWTSFTKQSIDAAHCSLKLTTNVRTNAGIWCTRELRTWSPARTAEDTEVVAAEGNGEETKPAVDPRKDRSKVIAPETSIRYMKSEAYKTTYGDEPVWVKYRRNFKGAFTPRKTRRTCIRGGVISCGSPCPICRDEYLVVDYRNVDLLKQFISPQTGELMDTRKIHVCLKKMLQLEVAIKKAKFYGYLTYQVPHRKYDYKDYYPSCKES